jgi:hypothetical protein
MDASPTYLDGNAAAGPLTDLLTFDITTTIGRCAGCRGRVLMARCRVYSAGRGLVLRCPSCLDVLVRLVVTKNRAWADMTGLASFQYERTDPIDS